jgi:hypothetical protein
MWYVLENVQYVSLYIRISIIMLLLVWDYSKGGKGGNDNGKIFFWFTIIAVNNLTRAHPSLTWYCKGYWNLKLPSVFHFHHIFHMNIQLNIYWISRSEFLIVKELVTVILKIHYLHKVVLQTDLPLQLYHHFQIYECVLDCVLDRSSTFNYDFDP